MEKQWSESSLPEMESFEACDEGNKTPIFQEINQQKLKMPCDVGIMEDRMQHHTGSAVIKMLAESFEVVLGEIDKEIKKYDPKPSVSPVSSVSMGKENWVGQPSINEPNRPSLSGHAAHLSLLPRMLLAKMPSSFINHVKAKSTWKRYMREGVGSDVGMAEALGEKRSAGNVTNQIELPKKKKKKGF